MRRPECTPRSAAMPRAPRHGSSGSWCGSSGTAAGRSPSGGLMQASRRYRSNAEEAEAALGRLVASGAANVWTDNHDGGRGRSVLVFTLTDSGNGNRNGEIPEETAFVLPLPPVDEGKTKVVDPAACLHEDVEETPTFDGYLNRHAVCGTEPSCRRAEVTA